MRATRPAGGDICHVMAQLPVRMGGLPPTSPSYPQGYPPLGRLSTRCPPHGPQLEQPSTGCPLLRPEPYRICKLVEVERRESYRDCPLAARPWRLPNADHADRRPPARHV